MITSYEEYYFILFPNMLIGREVQFVSKPPLYTICLYKGKKKEDQIQIMPIKEEKGTHTIFWLTEGKLQFNQRLPDPQKDLIKVEVHQQQKMIGLFYLDVEDYAEKIMKKYINYHKEIVKLNEHYDLHFQLFVGTSIQEVDFLLLENQEELEIKGGQTRQSHDRSQEAEEDTLNIHCIESLQELPEQKEQNNGNNLHPCDDIDEEESVTSSLPMTAPPSLQYSFRIDLQKVPTMTIDQNNSSLGEDLSKSMIKDSGYLNLKDYCTIGSYILLSAFMVYLSFLPFDKI